MRGKTCLAAVVGALVLVPVTAQGAGHDPRLRIERWRPVSVVGTGFHARERVRVVFVHPGATDVRRTRASAAGRFSVSFGRVTIGRCARYSFTATGRSGSKARLFRRPLPECPPL